MTIDRLLHRGIDILHAEAGPVEALARRRVDPFLRQQARVELGGDFGLRADLETVAQSGEDDLQVARRENVRRSAAEMERSDGQASADRLRDERDLAQEMIDITRDRRAAMDHGGVAAAI